MSSRQSRKTTKTTTTTSFVASPGGSFAAGVASASTPASGSQQSPGGSTRSSGGGSRHRPPSPTMISRMQEKQELASLNNRLATYIDRVRQLEGENRHLTTQIRSQEETIHREVTNIKGLYETELAEARKLLDETAREKAKLQVQSDTYRKECDTWREKYNKAARDLANSEKHRLSAEGQVNDLQARLNDAVNQRKHWENEYNKIKAELATLEKQLATTKKQLEDETIARVDLENRITSLKEELEFKSQIHAQELNESVRRTETVMEETDGRVARDYELRLRAALEEMREANEYQINATREETESNFTSKMEDLRRLAAQNDSMSQSSYEEVRTIRRRMDELEVENGKLRNQLNGAEARVAQLEVQLKREQDDHESVLSLRNSTIKSLREQIAEQISEYRDLMDTKIALDLEIQAYHKMLESEETRLNISASDTSTFASPRRTPIRAVGKKRKRAESEYASFKRTAQAQAAYESSASATGPVQIVETETHGKYVKLHNTSDEELSLAGWQLKHAAGEDETIFKFHRNIVIKPDAVITVWSSDQEQTHSPPSDLVMKSQRWVVADEMRTCLVNKEGDEMASRDMKKCMEFHSHSYSGDSVDSGTDKR